MPDRQFVERNWKLAACSLHRCVLCWSCFADWLRERVCYNVPYRQETFLFYLLIAQKETVLAKGAGSWRRSTLGLSALTCRHLVCLWRLMWCVVRCFSFCLIYIHGKMKDERTAASLLLQRGKISIFLDLCTGKENQYIEILAIGGATTIFFQYIVNANNIGNILAPRWRRRRRQFLVNFATFYTRQTARLARETRRYTPWHLTATTETT